MKDARKITRRQYSAEVKAQVLAESPQTLLQLLTGELQSEAADPSGPWIVATDAD